MPKLGLGFLFTMPARAELGKSSGAKEEEKPLLTDYKIRILELVARGLPNQEIADELHRSRETVKNHLSRQSAYPRGIYKILDVYTRRGAVVKIIEELGKLDPLELVSEEESVKCESLTERQLEILSWLANPDLPSFRGVNVEIAAKLPGQITAQTVKNHLRNIYKKLGLVKKGTHFSSARAAVIYLAYRRRKEATSPSHETPRGSSGAGG